MNRQANMTPTTERRAPSDANMSARQKAALAWAAVKGDGCTSVPDFTTAWKRCCDRHDADYSEHTNETGVKITRARADRRLFKCLKCSARTLVGRWLIAPAYWLGVRVFGGSHWKKSA
jgi:hypothetical protein